MKKAMWILMVILVAGALAAGTKAVLSKRKASQRASSVSTVRVAPGSIQDTVDTTGEVAPLNRVEIKPPIQGRIEQLLVDEGDHVRQGEILAWMSSSDRAAVLDAARAKGPEELKHWQDAYKPTPIVAPLSGVIILKNVVVGQTVDPTTVLYAMSDRLIVLADVDEADIGRVHIGMPSRVTLDSYPDRPVEGQVFQILYEGKNVSNVITYGVKVSVSPAPAFFRSQMTANVSFIVMKKDGVLLVPAAAVRDTRPGEGQVMVPGPNGKPVARDVKVGVETGDQVEILDGLSAGDAVIVSRQKYTPQQAPQSSPLAFTGPKRPGAANSGGGAPKR